MSDQQAVTEMFDDISHRYDFLNHLLSFRIDRRWRRKTSLWVAKHQPMDILDIATGTADLAICMAKDMPSATIIGVDLSKKMLEIGKRKIIQKQLDQRIRLETADAARLPFKDNCFDAVTAAFGVRNFEHLEQGLLEMSRVAKNDGVIAILEFSHPKNGLYRFYSRHILPLIGRVVSKHPSAYRYLPDSIEAFPEAGAFMELLKNNGLTEVGMQQLNSGIVSLYHGRVKKSPFHHNKEAS